MRVKTIKIKLYQFKELDEQAKNCAITDILDYLMNSPDKSKEVKKAIQKAEEMRTPWFTGGYIWDYAKQEVLDFANQYEFLETGEFYQLKQEG
jgi:hypothetical protein